VAKKRQQCRFAVEENTLSFCLAAQAAEAKNGFKE